MKFLVMAFILQFGWSSEIAPLIFNQDQVETISFTLRNNSASSIPLIIPNVMNPNLSPFSKSGVTLKLGQEILFKYKGRKRILLSVTKDLEGTKLIVNKLLKERKEEIDRNQ